jgi:TPR repeat protein
LERSANQGHKSAQLNLGLLYRSGVDGVPDYGKALYWLQLAAESGNPKAYGAIGYMHLNGLGVESNIEKAIHFVELSAQAGDLQSQYNLALLLKGVQNGPVDEERSAFWLVTASELGFGPAQVDLAISYVKGAGVEVDNAEAYKWALLATSNGDERAQTICTFCEQTFKAYELEEGRSRMKIFLEGLSQPNVH